MAKARERSGALLYLRAVAIKRGAFGSPPTVIDKLTDYFTFQESRDFIFDTCLQTIFCNKLKILELVFIGYVDLASFRLELNSLQKKDTKDEQAG